MAAPIITLRGFQGELDIKQIKRYMGMGGVDLDGELFDTVNECRPLLINSINAKACYLETNVSINNDIVDLDYFSVESHNLARILRGCEKAILLCATLGPHVDMLIRREGVKSKARAVVLNSCAITAIESYVSEINIILKDRYQNMNLRPRYSPGYGDLKLSVQKDLLNVLDTNRKIGVALSDSMLMTPEKTVSAIIGIAKDGCIHLEKDCDICNKKDCEFRLG